VGWYLMVPPEFPPLSPLYDWEHYGSYDTAKECEAAKSQLGKQAVADEDSRACEITDPHSGAVCEYDFRKENAQCLATDDPRLKPK
jgi:hypothetical protein